MPVRQVVPTDRWDDEDYENVDQRIAPINQTIDRLTDVNWTAGRLVQDVFQSLHKATPDFVDGADMDIPFRVNHAVVDEFSKQEAWKDLRENTVGDPYMSALATVSISKHLEGLLEKMVKAQEAADEAAEKREEFNEGRENGASGDELRELAEAADQAAAKAQSLLDKAGPSIGKAVRAAATEAAENADQQAEAAAGWGLDAAGQRELDPRARMELAARLSNDRMRKIAAMLGRLRNEAWAAETSRWVSGHTDLHGITLGDDLSRLVSTELVNLAVPELEADFLDRFSRSQLSVFELKTRAKEAKGSVVYVEDSSSSMGLNDREVWSRAVGLALLGIAKEHKRGFKAIVFGSYDQQWVFDFGPDASQSSLNDMLEYAEFQFMGGTCWDVPLTMAANLLQAEKDEHGTVVSDIVFATDDECGVTNEWLDTFLTMKEQIGFRLYGLSILGGTDAMEPFCDTTFPVNRLVDGSDITGMFRAVQTPTLTV